MMLSFLEIGVSFLRFDNRCHINKLSTVNSKHRPQHVIQYSNFSTELIYLIYLFDVALAQRLLHSENNSILTNERIHIRPIYDL